MDIYVDGSYNDATNIAGAAFVAVKDNRPQYVKQETLTNPLYTSSNNVGGEVISVILAIEYCLENNINDITIYYDYLGIEKWSTGEWRAKKPLTQTYRDYMMLVSKKINISFVKVDSHTNNLFNDMADHYSKVACGVPSSWVYKGEGKDLWT